MVDLILVVPVVLLLFAAVVVLEVFLAKRGKKQGLVLPFIFLGISVAVLAIMLTIPVLQSFEVNRVQNFMSAEEGVRPQVSDSGFPIGLDDFVQALFWFLMCNIPAAILLAVYALCRAWARKQRGLERMRVQDL